METKLNIVLASGFGGAQTAPPTPAPRADTPAPHDEVADLRLIIEPDPTVGGGYLYKTIDRRTGTVVLELPRTRVVGLPDTPGYVAGDVVRTRA